MYIHRKDGNPLGFAGISEEWKAPDGSLLDTFAILTTTSNKLVAPIHDRMPVLCEAQNYVKFHQKTS